MICQASLVLLLLLPSLQKTPDQPVTAVLGQWRLDKIRSPSEPAETMMWSLRVSGKQLVWDMESTHDGKTTSNKYVYQLGEGSGSYDEKHRWRSTVQYDDDRLAIRQTFPSREDLIQRWVEFYFEVKDHGYTLYFKQRWNKDVAIFERELYFRPVKSEK